MTTDQEKFACPEVASFWRFIASSLTRLMTVLNGLDADDLNWRPSSAQANSLYALAIHTLGNVEENVLQTLCGQPVHREREDEFHAIGSSAKTAEQRWLALRPRIETALASLTSTDLNRSYVHPRRGELTGREILIVVARHAAEHLGQAELTRDILQARQTPD